MGAHGSTHQASHARSAKQRPLCCCSSQCNSHTIHSPAGKDCVERLRVPRRSGHARTQHSHPSSPTKRPVDKQVPQPGHVNIDARLQRL